jgi:signal peptidase I
VKAETRKTAVKQNAGEAASQQTELSLGVRVRWEILAWFWIGLAFMLVNGTLGQARVIPSGSMENTLLVGDHLIMSRVGYDAGIPFTDWHVSLWRNPKRQQIIIFKPPYGVPEQPDLIKRVIGLPGDHVDIHEGSVWINGRRLQENYTTGPMELPYPSELLAAFRGLPLTVPQDQYFVLGDNRGNSYDTRYWGCVPRSSSIGTPVAIYMSVNAKGDAWNGDLANRFLAYSRALLHPSEIRWKRLFETFASRTFEYRFLRSADANAP